jgi:hypothetical protein
MRIPRRVEPVKFSDDQSTTDGLPVEITSVSIRELHRHEDGYIHLATKSGDVLVPFHSIRADALDSMLPAFREDLEKDSFASINASFRETRTRRGNGRGKPHSTSTLRYLCACYADIDYYREGLSFDSALTAIHELQAAGAIPHPSVIVNSGRGMWLLWFLHDPGNSEHAHIGRVDCVDDGDPETTGNRRGGPRKHRQRHDAKYHKTVQARCCFWFSIAACIRDTGQPYFEVAAKARAGKLARSSGTW